MYYCSIIRLIDNVSMGKSKSKHLVVQFTENLKECEHNMGLSVGGTSFIYFSFLLIFIKIYDIIFIES